MIYLAQPRGNRVRSIDRLKPKDRKKPANCNNSNVKFGKHLSNFSDLQDRYEKRVGDIDVKVIVNINLSLAVILCSSLIIKGCSVARRPRPFFF